MRGGAIPLAAAIAVLVVATALCGCVAHAEERLPEVVVTAPPLRDDTPAPRDPTAFATVIETREAPTSVETLTEALSNTVGVQVRRFGGLGDFSTVSVRGFSPGQVQVYLDGVPLSRADNEVVNLSDLPLDAIDHVEVYRGQTPLAFAQSAPGGVVNVVTRRPGTTPLAAASASYGSFDTRKVTLAGGRSWGAWDGLVFGQYLGSTGNFEYTNDVGTPATFDDFRTRRDNNAFDQGDVTARLAYRAAPFRIALTTDSFVKNQGVPGRDTIQSKSAERDTFRQIAHLDLAVAPTPGFPVGIDGALFGVHQEQTFTATNPGASPFVPTDVHDVSTTVGGQVVARAPIGTHQVPGVAVASSVERFVSTSGIPTPELRTGTSPPRTRTRLSLAAEDEILLLADRLSIVPSLRWELARDVFPGDPRVRTPQTSTGTRSEDFWVPRLGVRADLGFGVTLLGNGGRSARFPNLTELFGNSGVVSGNPDLRPETATSWDVGFRMQSPWTSSLLSSAGFEYAYFSSDLDDVIVLRPSSVSVFVPENVAAATIRGHEVSMRAALADRLLLTANYTHQNTRDEGEDLAVYRGSQLPGRPSHEAYLRAELVWSRDRPLPWAARLWPGRVYYDVNLIADNFLDRANVDRVSSRALHGVGVDVVLPWHGVRVAWELKNFTDDQTSDAAGFPLPGRATFVTVSYGFGAPRADTTP